MRHLFNQLLRDHGGS